MTAAATVAGREADEAARAAYRAFMEAHGYPNEAALEREDEAAERLIVELCGRARQEGLWASHLPPEPAARGRASSPTPT